ncbi:hypothetical protein [Candidatus Chloroploca asiatica]|uniref:HNH domain-containing protein n=1 Tax=Candidatus Chloroploca asiatica TaxID=1506545 RepID=A0A2H3L058_9CHLR|nr:hypothetical protein [Candidatus Chloroploca asiatica]PDV98030.1 hypothetical protein A9Q02_02815 [Candidatus Chloroploca asiatica]
MRNISELISFIKSTMSMTDVYQPAVILHLLERGGTSTRAELAKTLSGYDEGVQAYYDKILMRWPKITLTKHNIVPKSQADKHGYVAKDNIMMPVDDERNLQALCYRCNRAKRDQDATDFRQPRSGIIRDQSVAYVAGVAHTARKLEGIELRDKLLEKLVGDHARLIDQDSEEQLDIRITDMIETLLAIAQGEGKTESELLELIKQRREELGRLDTGLYLDDNVA